MRMADNWIEKMLIEDKNEKVRLRAGLAEALAIAERLADLECDSAAEARIAELRKEFGL